MKSRIPLLLTMLSLASCAQVNIISSATTGQFSSGSIAVSSAPGSTSETASSTGQDSSQPTFSSTTTTTGSSPASTSETASSTGQDFSWPVFSQATTTGSSSSSSRPASSSYTQKQKEDLGIVPTLPEGGGVHYGLYPQKHVDSESTVSALNALGQSAIGINGWYTYRGKYFAKAVATPYEGAFANDYRYFQDETRIIKNKTYWFEVTPILWKILKLDNGTYFLTTDELLDISPYYHVLENRTINGKTVYPNNYEHSDYRYTLNHDFHDTAFALGDEHIKVTEVDNGKTSTAASGNSYACPNTSDKLFGLSCRELSYTSNISSNSSRQAVLSDYARARGGWFSGTEARSGYGNYWTRSPYPSNAKWANYVSDKGRIDGSNNVNTATYCIRPAMYLRFKL